MSMKRVIKIAFVLIVSPITFKQSVTLGLGISFNDSIFGGGGKIFSFWLIVPSCHFPFSFSSQFLSSSSSSSSTSSLTGSKTEFIHEYNCCHLPFDDAGGVVGAGDDSEGGNDGGGEEEGGGGEEGSVGEDDTLALVKDGVGVGVVEDGEVEVEGRWSPLVERGIVVSWISIVCFSDLSLRSPCNLLWLHFRWPILHWGHIIIYAV